MARPQRIITAQFCKNGFATNNGNAESNAGKGRRQKTSRPKVLKGIINANTKSIVRVFQEKMDACVANIKNALKKRRPAIIKWRPV
jgi:transcriptional regulator NrdR family protein